MNTPFELAMNLFGPGEAGEGLITLGFFLGEVEAQTIQDSIPSWFSPSFEGISETVLEVMTERGLLNGARYQEHLDVWRKHVMELTGEGKEVIQRIGYEPVDLGSAFLDGHLYYPVQTLIRKSSFGHGGPVNSSERIDVVVIRSDRTLLEIHESKDEHGRRTGITRLDDGTLLQKYPAGSDHATWSWESIQSYLREDYPRKPIANLAMRIVRHLRKAAWLPDENDYWVLTCTVICSYVQAIFDAVPLILLNGTHNSGKSQLGVALKAVSCNAVMIGMVSPSSMMRLMDEARGLVVIDDLESIGGADKSKGKEKFSDMMQTLKLSYKKETAKKVITNQHRASETMNFFGVKVISNTEGVDEILGSRMLHVGTSQIPKHEVEDFLQRTGVSEPELRVLRDDLHTWAFDHVAEINEIYQEELAGASEREKEIAAPLRTIARLIRLEGVLQAVEEAVGRKALAQRTFSSAEDGLKAVLNGLAGEGRAAVSVIEIALRLRAVMRVPITRRNPPVWTKSDWVSKKARSLGYIDEDLGRTRIYGYQTKQLKLSAEKRLENGAMELSEAKIDTFCGGCKRCPYNKLQCEIMPGRLKKEGVLG